MDFTLNSPSQSRLKCPLLFVVASWRGLRDEGDREELGMASAGDGQIKVRGNTIDVKRKYSKIIQQGHRNTRRSGNHLAGGRGKLQATLEIKDLLVVQSLPHLLIQRFHQL